MARRLFAGYEPRLEIEGLGRAALLFVSNGAGLHLRRARCRSASRRRPAFELGLDLCAPVRATRSASLRYVPRLAAGRGSPGLPGVLTAHDVDRLRVVCDGPLPLQADGEDLGDVTEAVFEAERDAVSILV